MGQNEVVLAPLDLSDLIAQSISPWIFGSISEQLIISHVSFSRSSDTCRDDRLR